MPKRGQVTIFLIVGIVVLFIFAGIFFFISKYGTENLAEEKTELPYTLSIKPQISSYVENCLENIALPGIYLLGVQGGIIYLDNTENVLITENYYLKYGAIDGQELISVNSMEKELDRYIEENLAVCIDDFLIFREKGMNIEVGEPVSNTQIYQKTVSLQLDYRTTVIIDNNELVIDSYSTTIPLAVGAVIEEAKKLIEENKNNPASREIKIHPYYFVSSFPYNLDTLIYSINDQNAILDGTPFTFMFAIKNTEVNSPPKLNFIPNIVVRKGNFTYQLLAYDVDDDILQYSVEPEMFIVDENGLMQSILTEVGTFNLKIIVEDSHGLKDEQEVRLVVKE